MATSSDLQACEISNRWLSVQLRCDEKAIQVSVLDQQTGHQWGPAPLLALEIHDRPVRREERVEHYRIDSLHHDASTVHAVVTATGWGVTLGLRMELVEDELRVKLSAAEIYETHADRQRLFAVDVLPGLFKVEGTQGCLLLPINGGTLCRPAGKPKVNDRFLIYLEQPRWELSTILPIAAAWQSEGQVTSASGGMMMLASQSAAEAQCRVATDGQSSGSTGFAFCLRQHWIDPVELAEREFRFIPIPPKVDPVRFVAKRLRRHVIEDLGKPTLEQRASESPEVAYQLRAMTIKLFHGMQNRGSCIGTENALPESHFWNTMTFSEATQAIRKLRELGIESLYTQSVGWNARGHDGLYPTRFPVEPRLGGEKEFRELLRTGAELGYHCTVHDNFQMNIPDAPDWDPDHLIHDCYGNPLVRGWWAGGTEYATWPDALPESKVTGHLQRMKDLGVRGMYYCDYWMAPLEVNYHPKHRGTRSAHQRGMVAVLSEAQRIFGAVSTEFGTLPGAVACDTIACHLPYRFTPAVRNQKSWAVSALVDEPVPVWALALHGLVMHQAAGGPTWRNAMDAVAWGAVARDEWGVRSLPMGGIHQFDEARARGLKALYEVATKSWGHLITREMTTCDISQPGLTRTTFSDGTAVEADYQTGELRVNGKHVERPVELP